MSPWQDASLPVQAIWPTQDYPPFFPLLLAISGAAHSFIAAHILTTVFLICALPLVYLFAHQCIDNHWIALSITILFAISPSTWMNILGILSENLYIFISLLIILLFPRLNQSSTKITILFGVLLAMLILTRTIGLSMFVAYLITAFYMVRNGSLKLNKYIIPIGITIFINVLAKIIHDSSVPSQYISQLEDLIFGEQLKALIDAWTTAWLYYWLDEYNIPYIFVLVLGAFAIIGLVQRLISLKFDAVYITLYLCILLIWPHPGQATRFIYPVQAILLIYAFQFIFSFFKYKTSITADKPLFVLILFAFALFLPTLSYTWVRHGIGEKLGYQHIKEFYRTPDLKQAKIDSAIQKIMFSDMEKIKHVTEPSDVILYYEPAYITLLANRYSEKITFTHYGNEHYELDNRGDAKYVYLSKLHPRKTRKNINGLATRHYFDAWPELIWKRISTEDNQPVSIFLMRN
jgi:hypothetical protein